MFADPITLLLAALTLVSSERHTARDVRLIPLARAQEWRPVYLGGTVTFTSPGGGYFYLQDDTGGVRVRWATARNLRPGQYVTVHGTTTGDDVLTEVKAEHVAENFFHPFRPNRLPQPVAYTLTPDDAAYLDGRFVEVEVVVQRAWRYGEWIQFDLARGRGTAVGHVPLPASLDDARCFAGKVMKVRGVCRMTLLPNRQPTAPRILITDLGAFEEVRAAYPNPFEMPLTTARELATIRPDPIEPRLQVRVEGVVTLNQASRQLYLHDGTGVIHAVLTDTVKLKIGDRVSVIGFPRIVGDPQRLDNAQVRIVGHGELPPPRVGTPAQAREGKLEGQIVKLTGTLHEVTRQKDWMTLTVVADGLTFTAVIAEVPSPGESTPTWIPGSKVEVTGVVTKQPLEGLRVSPFFVVTKNAGINVLEVPVEPPPPSWWTGQRVAYLTAGFFGLFLLGGATLTALRLQVRRATALVRKQFEEKAKLEEQLKLAAKLETVGRLAGGIAHDFNNLLTVINGCAELLEDEIANSPAKAKRYAVEIQRAGRQAAALTRQLLIFSRRRTITPHAIDLNAVVTEAAQVLVRLMGEKVAVRVVTDPNLPAALAEASLLAQILLNLAVNARDAMPDGGSLTLSTALAEPGWVRLSASDTGVGMTEEVQAHIFEPYFTTKEISKGTGLGLSTVYGIVQTLGGRIRFRSEPGRGTTFDVDFRAAGTAPTEPPGPLTPLRLPIPPDANAAPTEDATTIDTPVTPTLASPSSPTPPSREGSAVVFLVEDDDSVRDLVRYVLEHAGLTVLAATGSEDAQRVLAEFAGSIDLLITDVVMPGLSGRQLAEQLRETRPGLRVLFMSGYTADEVLLQGVREDQVDFLHKPFSRAELVEHVRRALG